jgi:folate-binding protein YgfZ
MKKNQIVILEDRGLISVSGEDAEDFLQNILSNDIKKVVENKSIFSAIFTPQGKYLYEFFIIKSKNGYFLDCDNEFTSEIIEYLSKYKLRSKIEIRDFSSEYAVGIINIDKFKEIQTITLKNTETIIYRDCYIFADPRTKKLGARILSNLELLYLTIKKLNLQITDSEIYFKKAHILGVPIKGIKNLKDKLFGLEANFEKLQAIDFKKGCYVGQENTARMKLKNKIRRRLMPLKFQEDLQIGDELTYKNKKIGTVLIDGLFPFALINLFNPDLNNFKNKEILNNKKIIKLIE